MELTPRQIKMMKHAIGLTITDGKIQHQKQKDVFEAYRNYYSASKKMPEWEKLIESGMATAAPDSEGGIVYRLTEKGASALSEIFETKIVL